MSRKQYSKELKLELVKKHLEDGISYWKLGKEYGIESSIIRRWGYKYETFALFRYSVKLSFAELRTLDFTELFGGLKSFRINKTLKLLYLLSDHYCSLKSFRINKTLKPGWLP